MTFNSELENCLNKAVHSFNVRSMLTKLGLPEDVEATLELKLDDSSEPLASCKIASTVRQDHIQCGSISLKSFKNLVTNDFLNPAFNLLDLDKHLPVEEGKIASGEKKIQMVFSCSSDDYTMKVQTSSGCCCIVGDKCCGFK